MARRDSRVARALVDICHQRVPELPDDPIVAEEFLAGVRLHRLAPLAHVLLREERPELAAALATDRHMAKAIHLRSSLVLDELRRVLDEIPWAVFKGPVLSELAHPVPGLRVYGDIDVLVDPRTLREVSRRLEGAGWTVGDHIGHHTNPNTAGEMHWRTPAGLLVDMHWSMLNMARTRDQMSVSTRALLSRRYEVSLGLTTVPVLHQVDAFVHVCMHAGISGAHRLLWLLDVDQLVRQLDDWGPVADRARGWKAHAATAVVLGRARTFLGTPVPDQLFRELGVTAAARAMMSASDRLSPVPSLVREESVAKLVSRAARPTGPRMAVELGRKSALGAWHRRPTVGDSDPRPEFVLVDDDAKERYLRAVEYEAAGGGDA